MAEVAEPADGKRGYRIAVVLTPPLAAISMTRHRLNPVRLRGEILKRGLDGQTFAAAAGISAATLSHVIGGRSANPRTFTAIVRALARIPMVDGMDQLLEEIPSTADDRQATQHREARAER